MIRSLLLVFAALCVGATVFAVPSVRAHLEGPMLYRLFSTIVSDRQGVVVERNISYGPHARHQLDLYRSSQDNGRSPVVMFLYGGTWKSGERSFYGFVGAALAARGFTVVIPDYRLFPEVRWPNFMDDVARAYAWVAKENARGRFNSGDTQQERKRPIAIMGHSAGAHMAAMLAFETKFIRKYYDGADARPAALVGLSGPYSYNPITDPLTKDVFATAESVNEVRPVALVDAKAPPALLYHGRADTLVRLSNAEDLTAALRQYDRSVTLHLLDDVNHRDTILAMAWPFRGIAPILNEVVDFLNSISPKASAET